MTRRHTTASVDGLAYSPAHCLDQLARQQKGDQVNKELHHAGLSTQHYVSPVISQVQPGGAARYHGYIYLCIRDRSMANVGPG
jgi:hypothetical protein